MHLQIQRSFSIEVPRAITVSLQLTPGINLKLATCVCVYLYSIYICIHVYTYVSIYIYICAYVYIMYDICTRAKKLVTYIYIYL